MHQLVGYHRPESITQAIRLLGAPGRMALAGGTAIRHDGGGDPIELVDLQSLGLGRIEASGAGIELGATVSLQALVDSPAVPDLIRHTARAEQPSTLRTLATVGGTIGAADSDSLLLTALLVHDASVRFADGRSSPLDAVLDDGLTSSDLIVAITVASGGETASAQTGRTPADRPIVAALARRAGGATRLALCGVAPAPCLVDPAALDQLEPPGDFRGSADYRRHLAQVLANRVLQELVLP